MSFFPPSPRVLYTRNPLNEVVLQVRYPTILKIEAETPSAYQDAIRQNFPLVERAKSPLQGKVPPEILKALGSPAASDTFAFTNEAADTKITLTSEVLTISTASYTRWEEFRGDILVAIEAFASIYTPAFYSRVGLRYQNVVTREEVGLSCAWSELIRPELAGELTIPEWAAAVQGIQKAIRCVIHETGDYFTLQHGLVDVEGHVDKSYMIDFDYYTDSKTELNDANAVIDRLHGHSGNAFRWAISETLHQAMGPRGE